MTCFKRAGYTGDYYWTILEVDPEWTGAERCARPRASIRSADDEESYAVLGGADLLGFIPRSTARTRRSLPKSSRSAAICQITNASHWGIGDGDPRYSYHAYHVNDELDLLMELLDRESADHHQFAAQGRARRRSSIHGAISNQLRRLAKLAEQLQSRGYSSASFK